MQQKQNRVQIESIAYKKIMYHCMRYPSQKVYGIIVGQSLNNITDAFPLFHTPISNPSFTIAMNLVESNLKQGTYIQGFYQFLEEGEPLLLKMIQNNPQIKKMHLLRVWSTEQMQLKCKVAGFETQTPNFDQIMKGIKQGEHRFIIDMDSHLEDISLDFRNIYVK